MSADTALRLARYFGGDVQDWLNLQTAYELRLAELSIGETMMQISPWRCWRDLE